MGTMLVYTRVPEETLYRPALANSVHFAFSVDGTQYTPLNRNYGMLFAMGTVRENNTIAPKALTEPRIARQADGTFLIQARQTTEAGVLEPLYPQWRTADFCTFTYLGAAETPQIMPEASAEDFGIPGIVPGNSLAADDTLLQTAYFYWTAPHNTAVTVPGKVTARSADDVYAVRATARYADGSACEKTVDWELSAVNFTRAGETKVKGTVRQLEPEFPIFREQGDPVLFFWQGMWHYIFTNDKNGDRGFIVRRAATVEGLFLHDTEQRLILDVSETFVQTFWAPEFHQIGGALYLFFAVSEVGRSPRIASRSRRTGKRLSARA